jgi:hypothetical protein
MIIFRELIRILVVVAGCVFESGFVMSISYSGNPVVDKSTCGMSFARIDVELGNLLREVSLSGFIVNTSVKSGATDVVSSMKTGRVVGGLEVSR